MEKIGYKYVVEIDPKKIPSKRNCNLKLEVKSKDFFEYEITFEMEGKKTVYSGDWIPDYLLEWIIGEVVNRLFEFNLISIKIEGDLLKFKK